MKHFLVVLLALAVGGLGFALGRRGISLSRQASDPTQLSAILLIPETHARAEKLVAYFAERSPDDLETILETFRAARYDVDPIALMLLAEWWVAFDPEAAFEDANRWPLHDMHFGVATVIREWARRDPAAARAKVESIPGDERRERCTQALVAGWMDVDRDAAFRYIEMLPTGAFRQRSLDVFMARMASRDGVEATLAFAEAQPDPGVRRFKLQVFRRAATAVAAYDPRRAASWAELHADGPSGKGLLRRVGSAWAWWEPEAATSWIAGVAPSAERDEALRETYRTWLIRDREGAVAWMRQADLGLHLDPAIALFVVTRARMDPQEGLDWLERIGDPETRQRTTVAFARAWMGVDQDAASAWLASATLPDEVKQEIQKGGKRPAPTERRPPLRNNAESSPQHPPGDSKLEVSNPR